MFILVINLAFFSLKYSSDQAVETHGHTRELETHLHFYRATLSDTVPHRDIEAELLEEEAEMNQGGGESGKVGGLRRRRRTYSRTLQEHMKPMKQYGPDTEQHRDGSMGTFHILHQIIWVPK